MGASLSWLVVRGKPAAVVLEQLRLRPADGRGGASASAFSGSALTGGWFVVTADRVTAPFEGRAALRRISSGCEAVFGFVEEHVMARSAALWRNDNEIWSVSHDFQQGRGHLDSCGDLPPGYSAIRDRLLARQESAGNAGPRVDFLFDIPVELAAEYTGYRYDAVPREPAATQFEVLELVPGRGLLGRWWRRLRGL